MNTILLLGGGGREHALAWKLAQSPYVSTIVAAPGNAGIAELGECRTIQPTDPASVVALAKEVRPALVVIGPETPLLSGVSDALRSEGFSTFGASQASARIEGDKAYAKQLMSAAGIPTAAYQTFDDVVSAKEYVRARTADGFNLVVKASGPALGKGALVTDTLSDALDAVDQVRALGAAGDTIVIEDRLSGPEVSMMALVADDTVRMLAPSQDYKRAFDGDRGPNTGGMGAVAPAPCPTGLLQEVRLHVIEPILKALKDDGAPFEGLLYPGILMHHGRPHVLEFNARFGDPETQALMPLLSSDLFEALMEPTVALTWWAGYAACVVVASGGYPSDYSTGVPLGDLPEGLIFHAGTRRIDDKLLSSGGRVLNAVGLGKTLDAARDSAYRLCSQIQFEGAFYRNDIGRERKELG